VRARRELSAALADALARGVVAPAAFIASVDAFAGLAFARELRRTSLPIGASTSHERGCGGEAPGLVVGCEPRNVVACALLAVDNAACRAFLEMTYDAALEVPLLLLDSSVRVATLSREDLPPPRP
jgi:hypothetical protein